MPGSKKPLAPQDRFATQAALGCLTVGAYTCGFLAALLALYSIGMLFSGGLDPMTGSVVGLFTATALGLGAWLLGVSAKSLSVSLKTNAENSDSEELGND